MNPNLKKKLNERGLTWEHIYFANVLHIRNFQFPYFNEGIFLTNPIWPKLKTLIRSNGAIYIDANRVSKRIVHRILLIHKTEKVVLLILLLWVWLPATTSHTFRRPYHPESVFALIMMRIVLYVRYTQALYCKMTYFLNEVVGRCCVCDKMRQNTPHIRAIARAFTQPIYDSRIVLLSNFSTVDFSVT